MRSLASLETICQWKLLKLYLHVIVFYITVCMLLPLNGS